jgi:hypothetical protein
MPKKRVMLSVELDGLKTLIEQGMKRRQIDSISEYIRFLIRQDAGLTKRQVKEE